MSQTKSILSFLKAGHTITPIEALERFGCFRLSERIREIQALGFPIEKDWYVTDRGARVRRYALSSEYRRVA